MGIEILVEDRERPASEITRKSYLYSCSARTCVTSTVRIRHEQPTGTLRRVVSHCLAVLLCHLPTLFAYAPEQVEDKWGFYAESGPKPITDTTNLYVHWSAQSYLRGVQQMAYNHLSILAMSAECERVFSDTKLTISPNRNRLKEDIIEATECLVQWTRASGRKSATY